MSAAIEHLVTSGTFSLDGGSWDVENNVWIIGDDTEAVVIDPAHHAQDIIAAIGQRRLVAVVLTHGHNDHVTAAPEVADAFDAPIYLNPGDLGLWGQTHPEREPDREIWDGDVIDVAGTRLRALHTPGHTPGSTCFVWESGADVPTLFSGDTLFEGGPGATGRSYSHARVIQESIRRQLFQLPEKTTVNTGHGPSTTIGAEAQRTWS